MADFEIQHADNIVEKIAAIKVKYPVNLMARYFDGGYFLGLGESMQERLHSVIASGIENPDSQMGAYAKHIDDYELFSSTLDPMIRDYHGIPEGKPIRQPHDWEFTGKRCDLTKIDPTLGKTSMRVRVARNISGFPLPGAMSQTQRIQLENLLVEAFEALIVDPDFGGKYLSLTPDNPYEIGTVEYNLRVKARQMFKDMSLDRYLATSGISDDWPVGRGMYVSQDEEFLVWVGEEDHLRVMTMQRGGDLNGLFSRLQSGLQRLEAILPPLAHSTTYGYLTSCPTNLGAGMRASLHLPLPNLTNNGKNLEKARQAAKKHSLAVRGAGGEHSAAGSNGLVDISPSARLGVSEAEIMQSLFEGIVALWAFEQSV